MEASFFFRSPISLLPQNYYQRDLMRPLTDGIRFVFSSPTLPSGLTLSQFPSPSQSAMAQSTFHPPPPPLVNLSNAFAMGSFLQQRQGLHHSMTSDSPIVDRRSQEDSGIALDLSNSGGDKTLASSNKDESKEEDKIRDTSQSHLHISTPNPQKSQTASAETTPGFPPSGPKGTSTPLQGGFWRPWREGQYIGPFLSAASPVMISQTPQFLNHSAPPLQMHPAMVHPCASNYTPNLLTHPATYPFPPYSLHGEPYHSPAKRMCTEEDVLKRYSLSSGYPAHWQMRPIFPQFCSGGSPYGTAQSSPLPGQIATSSGSSPQFPPSLPASSSHSLEDSGVIDDSTNKNISNIMKVHDNHESTKQLNDQDNQSRSHIQPMTTKTKASNAQGRRSGRRPTKEVSRKFAATIQPVEGVVLGIPPPGSRKAKDFVKGKGQLPEKSKAEKGKKRDIPPPFGDRDIVKLEVVFAECPEKARFCDQDGQFEKPTIPADVSEREELRQALLRLFSHSNMPKVPKCLQFNVYGLCHYPRMQHLFHLAKSGVNLENLEFHNYGLAVANMNLLRIGEKKLNKLLDEMCFVGSDKLLHCRVLRAIDDGELCNHIAAELGKMRRHARNHLPDRRWVCCFCRTQMSDLTDMDRHTSTHTDMKPFKCDKCEQEFCQKVTYSNHMSSKHQIQIAKHDPRKSFTCRQDGCVFYENEREECMEHLRIHHFHGAYEIKKRNKQWPFNEKPGSKNVNSKQAVPSYLDVDESTNQSSHSSLVCG